MDPSSTNQNTRSWMTATHPDVLLRRYLPLLTGELLVVSTFLNIQCITVPGWLYADEDLDLFSLVWGSSGSAIAPPTDRQYIKPTFVVLLSFVSLLFGVVANVALFIRMLEKKIKWATRIMIIGAYGQGIISLALVVAFAVLTSIGRPDNRIKYTEGVYYALSCAAISLIVATGKQYQQYVNEAHYAYTMYDITPSQRQLILVSIVTITYTELCSILYAALEGWSLDDAMYWCVTTLTSIGFGDFAPKTFWGRAILLPVAAFGVFMVGSTIYTIRQVVLELFTLQLASEYSKVFGVPEGQLDVNLEHLEGLEHLIHIDQHTPNSTPVSSTAPGSNQRSRPAARSAPGKQKRSRSLEDRMLEIHDISNPPGDPSAKGPLNRVRFDVNQQRFSAPPTSAPSSMPERTTSRESARKRRSVDVASPLSSRAFTFPLPEQKTMVVSRADFLPQLQLTVSGESGRQKIVDATRETLQAQINVAAIATVANLLLFGWAFAYLEGWTYMEGVYFSFLALSTIGYGDLTPTTVQSRAIFIWHVFIGIGSMTYLGSLLAEQALDQWVVEMSRIEKRVGRYETKAKIKNIYKTNSRASSKKGSSSSANQEEWKFNGILGGVSKDYVDSDPGTAGTIEIQNAPSLLDTTVPQEVAETAGTTSDAQATTRTNEPETDSSDQPQSPQQPTISSTPTSPSQSDSLQISTPRPTSVHSSPSQTDSVRSSTFPHRRRTSVHSSMERPQSVMLIQPASNTMPFVGSIQRTFTLSRDSGLNSNRFSQVFLPPSEADEDLLGISAGHDVSGVRRRYSVVREPSPFIDEDTIAPLSTSAPETQNHQRPNVSSRHSVQAPSEDAHATISGQQDHVHHHHHHHHHSHIHGEGITSSEESGSSSEDDDLHPVHHRLGTSAPSDLFPPSRWRSMRILSSRSPVVPTDNPAHSPAASRPNDSPTPVSGLHLPHMHLSLPRLNRSHMDPADRRQAHEGAPSSPHLSTRSLAGSTSAVVGGEGNGGSGTGLGLFGRGWFGRNRARGNNTDTESGTAEEEAAPLVSANSRG